jgi:hypothetical protein
MKKVLSVLIMLVMVASFCEAKGVTYDTATVGEGTGVSYAYKTPYVANVAVTSGSCIRLRNAIDARDAGNPTYGSGVNCTGWKQALVFVDLAGTTPGAVIRPLFGNDQTSTYFNGTDRTLSADEVFVVNCSGNNDFYVMIPEMTGTTPTCTVYVQPIN